MVNALNPNLALTRRWKVRLLPQRHHDLFRLVLSPRHSWQPPKARKPYLREDHFPRAQTKDARTTAQGQRRPKFYGNMYYDILFGNLVLKFISTSMSVTSRAAFGRRRRRATAPCCARETTQTWSSATFTGFWGDVHGFGRIGVDVEEHDCGRLWGASVLTAEFHSRPDRPEKLGEQVIVALLVTEPPRTP